MVEYNKLFHREYKKSGRTKLAYSRILCRAVEWHKEMHGMTGVVIANVHFPLLGSQEGLEAGDLNECFAF